MVATTLLLAVVAVRLFTQTTSELSSEDSASFGLIGAAYVLTIVYALVLRRRQVGHVTAYVQVLVDVLLSSALVYLTGGPESPFTFTYSIAVVAGSILLSTPGALVAATASSLSFGLMAFLIKLGTVHAPYGTSPIANRQLIFIVGSHVLSHFLIAAMASYVSRQLSAAGGQLSAREADLRDLGRLQKQILDCMPSGLITSEASGQVSFINQAASTILGLDSDPDSRRSHQIEVLIPGVESLGELSKRAELEVKTPLGLRTLGLTVSPLESHDRSRLIVFQDLTDLRRMENELHRVDHLASLGKLAAQLAHEIRNPLAAMRGSAQLLSADTTAGSDANRLTSILIRESDRLTELLENFLKFARPPPPTLSKRGVGKLVRETLEMLTADPLAKGLRIETDSAVQVDAWVDEGQIRQVLINLFRNAFAAVTHHGTVRVSTHLEGAWAKISIWDSGGGIPRDHLERIFDPFFSTKEGGTGLGLSTAHSIVRAHGGRIQVTSSAEQGTEFIVSLPRSGEV